MIQQRLKFLVAATLCCSVFLAVSSRAAERGPYFRIDGGVNFAEDLKLGFGDDEGEMTLDAGYRVDLAGGYHVNRWLGLEVEAGFSDNGAESLALGQGIARLEDTGIQSIPVLANALFRYENSTSLVPFIGVGAGMVVSRLFLVDNTDTDFVFGYQLTAGVTWLVDERAWVDFTYKYLGMEDPKFEIGGLGIRAKDSRSHFIGASVVWKL